MNLNFFTNLYYNKIKYIKSGGFDVMDYADNFKIKNIITRILSFVIYFSAAGLMGKICAIIAEPAFSLIFKLSSVEKYQKIINIILYITGLIVMFAAVSFFSRREGFNDTEKLRFNYNKTVIAYISSGAVFIAFVIVMISFCKNYKVFEIFREYSLAPYFFPDDLRKIIYDSAVFPENSILYFLYEKIKSFLLLKWTSVCLTGCVNIMLTIIFYGKGRTRWIEKKNERIRQLKQLKKSFRRGPGK